MVTDELIRKQFILQILRWDAVFIYETPSNVIRQNFMNERAKALASFLASCPFHLAGDSLKPTYYFSIFPYLRFLDIKFSNQEGGLRSRLALYNRVV